MKKRPLSIFRHFRMSDDEIRAMMQKERMRTEGGGERAGLIVEDKKNFDERTLATLNTTELLDHQVIAER